MLTVKDIEVYYGDVQALWGPTLQVKKGQVVALVGANGAGKTTTLRTISGLLKPVRGSIEFEGHRLDKLQPHQIVELGVVQVPEGRHLFPMMTVRENLEVGSTIRSARRQRKENLDWVMSIFPRLRERESQLAGTLSGGEQQMAAIARGLMSRPKLLMLDEPSLGLAPILVKEIFGIVQKLKSLGVTVLLVEQNTSHTLAIADQGFVLENGRVVLQGTGQELLNNEHVKKAYLGA